MQQVAIDFEKRVEELTRKNRRAVRFMMLAIAMAAAAYVVFLGLQIAPAMPYLPPQLTASWMGDSAGNALWAANNLANLAATAAVRIWFIRERKMTLLLTHAMVLNDEADVALRILLNEETRA